MPSDHWFHAVFQALPDLVRLLLPGLQPSGEPAYAFRPLTLKKVAHHPDGLLWPLAHPGGSTEPISPPAATASCSGGRI